MYPIIMRHIGDNGGAYMDALRLEDRDLLAEINAEFLGAAGPLLTGDTLCKALGYTEEEFRAAQANAELPVPTFPVEGRDGLYANSWDVACWLVRSGRNLPR
jgi:hypothetical protein